MRLAIVHYHLRPGGVSRVIQHSLSALAEIAREGNLKDDIRGAVLAGEPPSPSMPIPSYAVVEALGYHSSANISPEQATIRLETAAKQALGGAPDLWHFHNHALGKNLIIPEIVHHLAQKGRRLLLQLHDFAEDGRPNNYRFLRDHLGCRDALKLGAHLYPQGAHVHYALINQRDLGFLNAAGVREEQLHYLPDAVSLEEAEESDLPAETNSHRRVLLYPTRAIRRKNLGEFLLWSTMAAKGDLFAITRAPKNPLARPIYDDWVAFAQSLKLPVKFALAEEWTGNFVSLLKSAYALVTTSVAEGFGLAFLEPWLATRPLLGRKLPEITDEFERAGIDLSGLYERIKIPIEWVGRDRFSQKIQTQLTQVYEAYGRTMGPHDIEHAVNAAITGEHIDFGRLDEDLQKPVIERIAHSPSLSAEIIPSQLESESNSYKRIQRTRQIVETAFNLPGYGKRLMQIYQAIMESEITALNEINADVLLDQFLTPERFCLLKT